MLLSQQRYAIERLLLALERAAVKLRLLFKERDAELILLLGLRLEHGIFLILRDLELVDLGVEQNLLCGSVLLQSFH